MKRVLLLVLAMGAGGDGVWAEGPNDRMVTDPGNVTSPQNAQAKPVSIDDLFYTARIGAAAWSPDGARIAYAGNASGRFNIWLMNADGSGTLQLTKSDERQAAPVWSPDGKSVVFEQDTGGDEMYDLYAVPSAGGAVENLTNSPENNEWSPEFSHNGRWIAFNSKPQESPIINVAVMDWKTRQSRLLTHELTKDHFWEVEFWSPDDRYIYAARTAVTTDDSDVYRIDPQSGAAQNLTAHRGKARNDPGDVSPDGKQLLFSSNVRSGFSNVAVMDLVTRERRWVTDTQWEAAAGDWSPKGGQFVYGLNADGRTSLYLATADGASATRILLPEGINTALGNPHAFSPDGTKLLVQHQDSTRPGDIWVVPVENGRPTQLTHSARRSLTDVALPPSQIVHYRSFDGKIISAILWMPFNLERDGSNPAIVYPHGGPTSQTTDAFAAAPLALASRGYIVIAPNVRGSTGYGIEFQMANHQDLGGGDLQDEVYALHWLKQTGFVDAEKVGITGASYGGFMALMAIGKTPDLWAAAVELFGIIDWKSMLQHSNLFLQEYEKGLLGDPLKDAAVYEAASPIKYIRDERAPLLILQGERDIRVPVEEARQVEEILKKAGKTVAAHYYADEGHGWDKREDQIDSLNQTIAWFDKYLKRTADGRK